MALQGSGAISIGNLATEFGGSTPHSMSEYYKGGGLVPNTGANTNVPTSGTISLSNFYNASAVVEHTVTKSGDAYGSGLTTVSGGNVNVFTNSVTANVSGGVGPFTYSWAFVSGTSASVTSPSSATTGFTRNAAAPTVLGTYNRYSCTYRCTVTDTGNSNLQKTVDVTVTTDHYYDN